MSNTLYQSVSFQVSRLVTEKYSTSFSMASRMFAADVRNAIYSIYGFVRIADEIVDTFEGYDQRTLIDKFESDCKEAMNQGISANPILQSFAQTVSKYQIPVQHIDSFLKSMKADLDKKTYDNADETAQYVYGSADVVGLMCLKVFCNGNDSLYQKLELPARKLGSAFQKVNFIRDLKNDMEVLGRSYFPQMASNKIDDNIKISIIKEIESDFAEAFNGIRNLPGRSKLAVLISYYYYLDLLKRIKKAQPATIAQSRIRVPDHRKFMLLIKASIYYKLRLV